MSCFGGRRLGVLYPIPRNATSRVCILAVELLDSILICSRLISKSSLIWTAMMRPRCQRSRAGAHGIAVSESSHHSGLSLPTIA